MIHSVSKGFSKGLDRMARPWFRIGNRQWSTFQVCGYTGLAVAMLLGLTLVVLQELLLWVLTATVATAVLTFFGLAMTTKNITGEERLAYYHHVIAIVGMVTLFLWIFSQPIRAYLDVLILGLGMFSACGRIGCLMVGCCHGRPYRWGVCYREEHAVAGFPPYLVGVRLFPIQLVESLWVFGTVLVGSALLLTGHPPGTALAWYVISYGFGRFCFEFLRGDAVRPYRWGFSEAQWTSLLLMGVVVGLEATGHLPLWRWHILVTIGLLPAMVLVGIRRHFQKTTRHQLLQPRHIQEVAWAVDRAANMIPSESVLSSRPFSETIHVAQTSLGVQISYGKELDGKGCLHYYTLSSRDSNMIEATARTVADLILELKHPSSPSKLISRNRGVFHLLVHSSSATV